MCGGGGGGGGSLVTKGEHGNEATSNSGKQEKHTDVQGEVGDESFPCTIGSHLH